MKKYVLFFLSTLISTVYTLLIIFSVNGFARNSFFEKFIFYMNIVDFGFFLISFIAFCAVANVFFVAFLARAKLLKETFFFLSSSFICGFLIVLSIISIKNAADFFYDFYINVFYQGIHYDGEDKVQQILSYIIRGMTACFLFGGGVSCIFKVVRERELRVDR